MTKEKGQKTNNDLQKTTQETKSALIHFKRLHT